LAEYTIQSENTCHLTQI